jgi:uncharacterized protein YkwD
MWPREGVDVRCMAPPRHSRSRPSPLALLTALFALCVCLCAAASSALASPLAKADSSHASAPAHKAKGRKHHWVWCAKRADFHSVGGPAPKRRARCHKVGHTKAHHPVKHHAVQHQTATPPAPPTNGACPGATLEPSPTNLELVRAATLCLVNRERTSRGESALKSNSDLQLSAQGHSQSMASGDYFEHVGKGGDTPLARMRSTGYIFSSRVGFDVGENIGWGTLWLASPRSMVASWMASPGHRANILDAHFRDTGVGISPHPLSSLARGQPGAIYTQDFGVIVTS